MCLAKKKKKNSVGKEIQKFTLVDSSKNYLDMFLIPKEPKS